MSAIRDRIPSGRTWVIFGSTVAVVALSALLSFLQVGGEKGAVAAADIGEVLAAGASAVVILICAFRLGVRQLGRPWALVGLGALSYAVGDTIWTIIEVGQGREVPYPGPSDIFYLLEYPLFALGLIVAALAFKNIVSFRLPTVVAWGVAVGLSVVVYFGLLKPTVFGLEDVSLPERIFSTLYPIGDAAIMIGAAVFMLGVVLQLGRGKLSWPWLAVALGTVIIAASDVSYSWLTAYDLYKSGVVIDYGWGLGHALLMLGALITLDLAQPSKDQVARP
jgi:hypothetical protein